MIFLCTNGTKFARHLKSEFVVLRSLKVVKRASPFLFLAWQCWCSSSGNRIWPKARPEIISEYFWNKLPVWRVIVVSNDGLWIWNLPKALQGIKCTTAIWSGGRWGLARSLKFIVNCHNWNSLAFRVTQVFNSIWFSFSEVTVVILSHLIATQLYLERRKGCDTLFSWSESWIAFARSSSSCWLLTTRGSCQTLPHILFRGWGVTSTNPPKG